MRAYLFEINLRAGENIVLPERNKGNVLRGAFGTSLRGMVCLFPEADCSKCSIPDCVYRKFFNSMPDPNIRKLSRNENIPRPYVIKPPLERKTLYLKDELIKYEMVIFGRAIDFLPYILITLKSAAQNGLGKNRGRAYLERIHQKNPVTGNVHELFSSENDMVYPRDIFFTENDFKTMDVDRVRLNFKTPAVIKDRGKFIQTPAFDTLIKRIRDRFSALSWFYEGIEPDIDFKNFTVEAEKVKTVRADVAYMQTYRRTRNPSAKQNMSGFVGSLIYQGPISQYMPYLLFGQYMHVGKAAVFGNGWYEAEV